MPASANTQELYEALEKVAPELEALAREAEIQRRPPEALGTLLRQARLPGCTLPGSLRVDTGRPAAGAHTKGWPRKARQRTARPRGPHFRAPF